MFPPEFVREKMKIEKSDKKVRLTIEIDFDQAHGFLKVNEVGLNRWGGHGSLAAWPSALCFIAQMVEQFEQEYDHDYYYNERVNHEHADKTG